MSPDAAAAVDPRDSELLFKLLSLDVARTLYPLIGLAIDDNAGLVHAIRDALGSDAAAHPPPGQVDRVLALIRQRLGPSAADVVRRYAATAFHHAYRAKHV